MNTKSTYSGRGGGASGQRGWRVPSEWGLLSLALIAAVPGCSTVKETTPARTATEELLLSTATDQAIEPARFPWLDGKKVFVEDKYFESYDKGHAVGLLRERISASGALLVPTNDKAEVIVELRADALSMDLADLLVGIPGMAVPIPLAGPVQTPELALYKSHKFDSITKVALFAYERASGRYVNSAGPMLGRAHLHLYKALFVSWKRTDVAEFRKHHKQKAAQANSPPPHP